MILMVLEVYHTKHNDDDVKRYKALATKHNLFITGGSDYHGIQEKHRINLETTWYHLRMYQNLLVCYK